MVVAMTCECYCNHFVLKIVYDMSKVKSLEELIERVKEIHGDKYDFSKFIYVDSKTPGIVICHEKDKFGFEHGEFKATQNQLLAKRGCPKCGGNARFTKEDVEKRLSVTNTRNYKYEIPDVMNSKSKITFYCDKGHKFFKRYCDLVYDFLCPHCNPLTTVKYDENGKYIKNKSLTTEEFIEKSKEIWGDLIDYSNTICKGNNVEVEMRCKKHNVVFMQTPYHNLKGFCGCKECENEKKMKIKHIPFDEFVKIAREIHGDLYEYNESTYKSYGRKMEMFCKKHGSFWATPNNHIYSKSGCPKCKASHLEMCIYTALNKNNINYIYQFRNDFLGGLELDFYIPSKNIAIECQGEQHFKPKSFGCKDEKVIEENFKLQQQRDQRKKQLCEEQGIHLIYYLNEEYNQFLNKDEIYFNNIDNLVEYINKI